MESIFVFGTGPFDEKTSMGSPWVTVKPQVLDAETQLSELAENNELELTLVVRLSASTNPYKGWPSNGGSTQWGNPIPSEKAVFGDKTRLKGPP